MTTTNTKPGDWMENAQTLANIGHALAGALILTITALFTHSILAFAIIEILFYIYVSIKEFWYDLKYETGETISSSTEDAIGYLIGNIIGILLILLAIEIKTW